ncbi:hypothetical protein MCAG_02566 [Micromonospora sp. ATCC 39149]|uniref:Alpha/beta hydrolase n=1 Tax=Micromonospora carbonacea TaxID=47853 RepID=A0A7D5Y814_9ACTN|nr:hypothetical protein [Micromonospora sp. ATCC 39149]EEP72239.1 hypothetical protein MCAG_02566 [Micromonospora sp. ATCC 39149]QLJ98421.1 hypothetical protein HZU44_27690 [Micromonospora carbonacea]
MRPERVRLLWLLVLTVAPVAAVAGVLAAYDFSSVFGMAPQVSAISPYATFFDMRWVLVYHNSWAMYAVLLAGVIVLRGLFSAVLIGLAWPAERPRPSFRQLSRRNLLYSIVAHLVLLPWAAMAVIAADVSLAWFQVMELAPLLILAPWLQRGGIVPRWWCGLPSADLIGWSLLNFLTLTLGAVLVWSVPDVWTVPAAAVTGVANGLLWQRKVRAAVLPERVRWSRVPVVPLVIAMVLAPLFFFDEVEAGGARGAERATAPIGRLPEVGDIQQTVIFLSGYDSDYRGDPEKAEPPVIRFSYRGTDGHGRPLPYSPADTHQSIPTSAHVLAKQVERLHNRTGRKVALVGESEGALIARYYLERLRHPAVDSAVMLSHVLRAGRVYYPPPQADTGWGVATGWQLRAMFALIGVGATLRDDPEEPFIRSLLDEAPFYRNEMLCPVRGVRLIAILPLSDAIAVPAELNAQIPVVEVVGWHGQLLKQPRVLATVADHVTGKPVPDQTRWDYSIVERAAGAWQAPPLPLALNPAWHAEDQPDRALRQQACPPT